MHHGGPSHQRKYRRKQSYKYVITVCGESKKISQQFLLKTLDISQMTLRYASNNSQAIGDAKRDKRGRRTPANKTPENSLQAVFRFIEKLPVLPSHYCCNKTSRKYIPYCKSEIPHLNSVSPHICREIFTTKFNNGFHLPKKEMWILRKSGKFKQRGNERETCEEWISKS